MSHSRLLGLWLPQTLAMTARGLTTFALDVWVYQTTHSATLFALLSLSATLPGVVLSPLVGWVVDRLGARRCLLLSDLAAALAASSLLLAFELRVVEPRLLYLVLAAGAVVTSMQWPAYTALVTVLAPPEKLARSAAMMQLGYAGQQVLAPALAGWLLGWQPVARLLQLDVAASILAVGSLVLLPVSAGPSRRLGSPWRDLRGALELIGQRGLLRLAGYISASYFPGGFVLVLATPLVLSVAGPKTLGLIMATMGIGMLLGSVIASQRTRSSGGAGRLLGYDALLALAMLSAGFATRPTTIAVVGFAFLFGLGGIMAEDQAIWQTRIPLEAQGRVFALRRTLTWASLPLGYGVAGPLADHVFKPALSPGGSLFALIGPFFGTGPARGIALLIMCAGALKACVVLWGTFDDRLRRLDAAPERALPEQIPPAALN